jgi:hypothetical protein
MSQRSHRQMPVRARNSLLALALTLLTASTTAFAQNGPAPLQPRPQPTNSSALAPEAAATAAAAAAETEATNAQASEAQAQAAYEAALAALAQQQWGQAELLLERALMFQPEHTQALLQLATLLAQRDRLESAQALIAMLLQDPRTPPAHRRQLQALLDSTRSPFLLNAQATATGSSSETLRPPGRTQLLFSLGHSRNPLGVTSATQLTLTLPEGPVALPLATQARATAVASLALHHQTPSGFEIYAQSQTTALPQARSASRFAIAGPLGLPGHLWSLSTQTTLDGTTRQSAALIKTLANSPTLASQAADAQPATSPAPAAPAAQFTTTQLTASLWREPNLGRSGWLLRAQRNFLPHASIPITTWGEYEHSGQGAPNALRSGVQASAALAPRWHLQSLLQAQADTSGYSPLLKNNAPRRLLSLQAELEYRWPEPLLGGQASASVYATRRWSNLPLFAWQDGGLRLAWLRQW